MLRRFAPQGLRARYRLSRSVGLWYHPEYAAPELAQTARVSNVEPRRGELVLARLMQEGLIKQSDVNLSPVTSMRELLQFHSPKYVEDSTTPPVLGRIFGLEASHLADPEALLRWARRQVGGTIEAAQAAAAQPGFTGINLGGGFHHAEPEQGSGFCIYNDIAVAIATLRASDYRGRIAIVDLDFHQGNGNTVGFIEDDSVLVYSLHGAVWSHGEGRPHETHLTGTVTDKKYMAALRTTLSAALNRFRPSLVFYIAGNDVMAHDRLGSFWLTPVGVLARDRFVVDEVRRLGASLVVTLGGGYSRRAWRSTYYLVRYVLTDMAHVDAFKTTSLRARFERIAQSLDETELMGETEDFDLTEEDIYGELAGHRSSRRILDYYAPSGLEMALERYGVFPAIRKRGFRDFTLESEARDDGHVLRVLAVKPPDPRQHLLFELVLRRTWLSAPQGGTVEVLYVEWLLLQDPTEGFSLERPPLPGQSHPGLGIALETQEMMVVACRRLGLAGVVDRPAHFHNGLGGAEDCYFWEPEHEGRFRAMLTVLAGMSPAEAAEVVEAGDLILDDGSSFLWEPNLHVLPVSEGLVEYFGSETYRSRVRAAMAKNLEAGLHVRGQAA